MLSLAGVLLSCGALCLASPVPPAPRTGCAVSSLIRETLDDIQTLKSKGSGDFKPPNNTMEEGENIKTYLERFIEALKSSKPRSKERPIAHKLQKILDARKSCLGWMEQDWEPVEENDFFSNLEYLLRFLNHNIPLEETG